MWDSFIGFDLFRYMYYIFHVPVTSTCTFVYRYLENEEDRGSENQIDTADVQSHVQNKTKKIPLFSRFLLRSKG